MNEKRVNDFFESRLSIGIASLPAGGGFPKNYSLQKK